MSLDQSKIDIFFSKLNLTKEDKEKLEYVIPFIFEKNFSNNEYSTFIEQITSLNNDLFNEVICQNKKYLFLDKYTHTQEYLIKLINNDDNVISEILKNNKLLKILSSYDTTDIFWYNNNCKQKPLKLENNSLFL
jgi:hypothetical protein